MSSHVPPQAKTADSQLDDDVESLIHELGVDPMAIELQLDEPAAQPQQDGAGGAQLVIEDELVFDEAPAATGAEWSGHEPIDPEVYAAEIELIQAHAENHLASELERVRSESEQTRIAELARVRADAEQAHLVEVARLRSEAAESRLAEVERLRSEAAQERLSELEQLRSEARQAHLAEVERLRVQAEQARVEAEEARVAEVARVRTETEQAHSAEVERLRTEAEQARLAELERLRIEAEQAHTAEVERLRLESKQAREAELERLRLEAEQERRAAMERFRAETNEARASELSRRDHEAQGTMASELARVRGEAEEKLARELGRVRAEMDQALAQQIGQSRAVADEVRARAQAESDALRADALKEARLAAEGAAARALQDEVTRVRAETEARLGGELARVREQAEQATRLQQLAQQQAHTLREHAVREVQSAAQKAATRAFEIEGARIRAEAETRLQAETERARAEANQRLEAEIARLREEAQVRRAQDLEEVRAQVSEIREAAVRQAEADAASHTARVAQWQAEAPPRMADVDSHRGGHVAEAPNMVHAQARTVASEPRRMFGEIEERPEAHADGDLGTETQPFWKRKWALAAGIAGLAVVGSGFLLLDTSDPSATAGHAPVSWEVSKLPPRTDTPPLKTIAPVSQPSPVKQPPAAAAVQPRNSTPAQAASRPTTASNPTGPGMLQVFSRIPLDLIEDGKKLGTTDDGQVSIPKGRHQIELVNRRFNYRDTITLNVDAGQLTSHTVSLPSGRLRVTSTAGAEVWIEGEHVGSVPLGELVVPIGTREVVVRHPQLGERRQSVEVAYGSAAEVSVAFEAATNTSGELPLPRMAPLSQPPGPRDAIR